MSVVTIRDVEAKRSLSEETSPIVLHRAASSESVEPQRFHCKKPCRVQCIPLPDPFVIECLCIC